VTAAVSDTELPGNTGVVAVVGHAEPVIYHLTEVVELREQSYHGGGTMRMPVATGRWVLAAARYLGRVTIEIDDAIRAAVREDCRKRGINCEP